MMETQTNNPSPTADLAAENAELRRRLAEHDEAERQRSADEAVITEKMQRGLSREQASAVIKRQRDFDAAKPSAPQEPPKHDKL